MEKLLYLAFLTLFAVLGSTKSASSNKFLLRELIRELEEAQVEKPTTVPTPATTKNVEDDDLTGLKNNGSEEKTTGKEEAGDQGTTETAGQPKGGESTTKGQEEEAAGKGEQQTGEQKGEESATSEQEQGAEAPGKDEEQTGEQKGEESATNEQEQGGEAPGKGEEQTGEQKGEESATNEQEQGGKAPGKGEEETGEQKGKEDATNGQGQGEEGGEQAGNTEEETGNKNSGQETGEETNEENPDEEEDKTKPEVPVEPVKGEKPSKQPPQPPSGPSNLEQSAVRMARLVDKLSRMLATRTDTLARIDKVLSEVPEINYPSTEKLAEKQERLKIMSIKVEEMKKVLSNFFDDIFDRFYKFMSDALKVRKGDDQSKDSGLKTGMEDQLEKLPPGKSDSVKVQEREQLKRLLTILYKSKNRL